MPGLQRLKCRLITLSGPSKIADRASTDTGCGIGASRLWDTALGVHAQAQTRYTPALVGPVFKSQGSAMGLCNLAREHQTDATPTRLGGEERNKQVRHVRNTRALILDRDFH